MVVYERYYWVLNNQTVVAKWS